MCKCVKCCYEWESRTRKPKCCPCCKSYQWEHGSAKEAVGMEGEVERVPIF